MQPQSIPGVGAVVIHNDKFLLQLRDDKPNIANPNRWAFIGGGIDEGEEPLDAMKRECMEEIGFTPKDIRYQGHTDDDKYRFCIYLSDEEVLRIVCGEGQEVRLFSLDEIPLERGTPRVQLFFSQYRGVAEKMLRHVDINPEELGLMRED